MEEPFGAAGSRQTGGSAVRIVCGRSLELSCLQRGEEHKGGWGEGVVFEMNFELKFNLQQLKAKKRE